MKSPSDALYLPRSPVRPVDGDQRLKAIGPLLAVLIGVGLWALLAYTLWLVLS